MPKTSSNPFSRFDKTPACDRHTDGQTHVAYTALVSHSARKSRRCALRCCTCNYCSTVKQRLVFAVVLTFLFFLFVCNPFISYAQNQAASERVEGSVIIVMMLLLCVMDSQNDVSERQTKWTCCRQLKASLSVW